jgi:hypothetical protein
MENNKKRKIFFIAGGHDFHAIDWYRNITKICNDREVCFVTDLIQPESHSRLLNEEDNFLELYNIDWLLFKTQSKAGNIWRNFIKLIFFPIQVQRLKRIAKKEPQAIYHAHTMYYLFLGWRAGIKYIGSPQGSEILVRPFRSKLYRYFAIKSLKAAEHIIIDSVNLQNGIRKLSGKEATIVQYGIDVDAIVQSTKEKGDRLKITSIRGLYPLYRIHEILNARNNYNKSHPLVLFYPFWEDGYKEEIINKLMPTDINMGRIPTKNEVYRVLASTLLAISIPESDSSPRSVAESIFCGACVAVTYNPWIESLPECMHKRIYIVDLDDQFWFLKAIDYANKLVNVPFLPSEEAMNMFDQKRSMKKVADLFY